MRPNLQAVVAAFLVACFLGMPVIAQPQLRPDTPKLDTAPVEPAKPVVPLKGGVQKSERGGDTRKMLPGYAGGTGGMLNGFGRARRDNNNPLRAKARDDRLTAQVESGIGIIGVKFVLFTGKAPVINRVFPLTPASKHGVQSNDVIVAVDGVPTMGLSKEEVYDLIIGTPGTAVTLSLRRDGDYRAVTMTRMDLNDITDPFVRRDYMMSM